MLNHEDEAISGTTLQGLRLAKMESSAQSHRWPSVLWLIRHGQS